jgi:predicted RNase H-like nuclease (RuvC/YqgF family)
MLYLAIVQKQTRFLRNPKTELKLLACKQGENNWSVVAREELIPMEAAHDFNAGVLVLVDLTANQRIQRIQEAAPSLVRVLQNFSRLQEKWEEKEREQEAWNQGLIYQASELNRRERELRLWQQQLQNKYHEMEKTRQKLERLQQALELKKNDRGLISNPVVSEKQFSIGCNTIIVGARHE